MSVQDTAVIEQTGSEDAEAGNMLADAVSEEATSDSKPQDDSPWADPDSAKKYIDNLRKENASWRKKYRDAEPALKEWEQLREASKSELERAQERAQRAEEEREKYRVDYARMSVAARHNIPADLANFLGNGSEEDMEENAKKLAQYRTPSAGSSRPGEPESLRPGGAPLVEEEEEDFKTWFLRQVS